MLAEVDILSEIDIEAVIPCEHSSHVAHHEDSPAKFLIRRVRPCCPYEPLLFWICDSGMKRAKHLGVRCSVCRHLGKMEEFWTVVKVL